MEESKSLQIGETAKHMYMNDRKGNRAWEWVIRIAAAVALLTIAILLPYFFDGGSNGESGAEEKKIEQEQSYETAAKESGTKQEEQEEEDVFMRQAQEKLLSMTLTDKIYQLFIVTPETLCGAETVTAADVMRDSLMRCPVGGIIYFEQNLIEPEQTKEMLQGTQEYAKEIEGLPLFLCVDEEGGTVARIGSQSAFGTVRVEAMQNVSDVRKAYEVGDTIGGYLSELGFNLDFAPDADVLTNPSNQVIASRSFGSDAEQVTELALAVSKGLQKHGILSTFKHFPGHGATEADSHEGLAYTDKTYEQLLQAELKPFQAAEAGGVDVVMTAHISVPEIVGDNTPCSLSRYMITDILRQQLGYNGLIVTDALNMGAIVDRYGADRAAVMAVQAGNDLLLMPQNLESAAEGIRDAVASGELAEEMIDNAVRRILYVKYQKAEF